jgi:predicted TIM-barrel fold metal-dependent hydrolase
MYIRFLLVASLVCLSGSAQQTGRSKGTYSHPGFKPSPPQTAMPKSTLVVKETKIEKAKYPVIDVHFHGRMLNSREGIEKVIAIMDQVGIAMIVNLDAGFGKSFDQYIKVGEPYRERFIQMARVNWEGVNEPGWSAKTAAELERCFQAGAQGLKISKELGLDLKNKDGSFIQCDDPRLDPIWAMCAKHNKPVVHHIGDQYGRFLPIGPENERYEAGLWRDSPAGNYYGTGQPGFEELHQHREKMLAKHPKTVFILAHIGMMGFDLSKVAALLDKYPNANVDVSAAIQEVGRQPLTARRFLIKYQDRVFFGTDGESARMNDLNGFWRPHFRFFETDDEYFDHPAQLLSPQGAPLHGRWKIYGVNLPDEALRKIYYENTLKYFPAARPAMKKHLAARRAK